MTQLAGLSWQTQFTAVNNQWYGLCYGNGRYVATSIDGTNRVMYSDDNGNTWSQPGTDVSFNRGWLGVCYGTPEGNPLYVAVSNPGSNLDCIMTSSNGITWTLRNAPAGQNSWRNLCYGTPGGNPLFVAVGASSDGQGIMTSQDGISWIRRNEPSGNVNGDLVDVCYANGKFVAVGKSGSNNVMYSTDGITWTKCTYNPIIDTLEWRSVCYGNGKFVAVSQTGTGNRVMSSNDGINWTIGTSAADNQWLRVTYGGGLFVAVGRSGTNNRVMTSLDGLTWTTRTTNNNNWMNVVYNGTSRFVATSITGTNDRVMTSDPTEIIGAPTITSGIAGNGQVTLDFTVPTNYEGSPISGYTIESYNSSGTLINATAAIGASSPITITGLTNGTTYKFKIYATSPAGNGTKSVFSLEYTPLGPENPICYIGDTKVLAKDIQTGVESQVCVKDITPEKYLVYSSTQNKFVPVRVNCISGEVDKFILIKKDLLGENKPSEDFYVTASHPILYKNCEIEAKNIIGAKKATLEKQMIYTLVTDNREALAINNIDVLCWEYKAFMKRYKKTKNAVWIENENMSIINK